MKSVMPSVFLTRIWIMDAQTWKLVRAVVMLLAWAASPILCPTYHGARAQTKCCKKVINSFLCFSVKDIQMNESQNIKQRQKKR